MRPYRRRTRGSMRVRRVASLSVKVSPWSAVLRTFQSAWRDLQMCCVTLVDQVFPKHFLPSILFSSMCSCWMQAHSTEKRPQRSCDQPILFCDAINFASSGDSWASEKSHVPVRTMELKALSSSNLSAGSVLRDRRQSRRR
jgi:hypothetical protein